MREVSTGKGRDLKSDPRIAHQRPGKTVIRMLLCQCVFGCLVRSSQVRRRRRASIGLRHMTSDHMSRPGPTHWAMETRQESLGTRTRSHLECNGRDLGTDQVRQGEQWKVLQVRCSRERGRIGRNAQVQSRSRGTEDVGQHPASSRGT